MSSNDRIAPVIPLFGGTRGAGPSTGSVEAAPLQPEPRVDDPSDQHDVSAPSEPDADEIRQRAEAALVRRLRAKQLSVSEARSVLRENGLDRNAVEDVVDEFLRRSYLDDHTLASLLVISGSERKGQGRIALARSLAQRGIARDIIDDALAELPDDDAERALDFARSKASGMSRLDYDTALRRLHGQLARRGYGGSVAMDAARTALGEVGVRRGSSRPSAAHPSGVRFVDSE